MTMTDTIESLDFDTRTGKLRIKTPAGWRPATAIETSELEQLRNRIKRLEEAGDTLALYPNTLSIRAWRKAKEAKP